MKWLAILIAILIAATVAVADERDEPSIPGEPPSLCGTHTHRHTVDDFRRVADSAYAPRRWRDPTPAKHREAATMRHHLKCAADPDQLATMRDYRERVEDRPDNRYMAKITPPGPGILAAIRACESGTSGGYQAIGGPGGIYRGAYQFDGPTWRSVGGKGDPADALPREQDYRAALLYRREGASPWPVCGV